MKRKSLNYPVLTTIVLSLALAACSQKESKVPDIEQNFVGRWWMEKRYNDTEDRKIVERISITFYDPEGSFTQGYRQLTSSSDFYSYHWIYTVTVDGVEDESRKFDQIGEFTTTETEIHFIPFEGEARTYQYDLVTIGDTRVVFTDQDGNTIDLEYKNPTW